MICSDCFKSALRYSFGVSLAFLLLPSPSKAELTFTLFQQGNDVILDANGTLILPPAQGNQRACASGALVSSVATFCTGPASVSMNRYVIDGTTDFGGMASLDNAIPVSGLSTRLTANIDVDNNGFYIDPAYSSGASISSSATFLNQTLTGLGFTTPGEIGSWSLLDTNNNITDTIRLVVSLPSEEPPQAVPGPLPLLGMAATLGWSRCLRRRLANASRRS